MTLAAKGLQPLTRVSKNPDPSVIRLSDYGVTASVDSDQSALVQAAFDALSNGMSLVLDVTGSVRIDSTVTLLDLRNINMYGLAPVGYTDIGEPTFKLVWYGANGGTVLRIDRVRDSTFRGFGVFGSAVGGANGADVGLFLTQDGSGSNISSHNQFQHCTFHASSTRSGWIGAKIENTTDANNEQHTFEESLFVGGQQSFPSQTGTGIYLGHVNVKHILIKHCARIGLEKFVDSAGGSFRAEYNYSGSSKIVYSGSVSDAISIIGEESESDGQIISLTGSGAGGTPVAIIGCRFENLRGGQAASGSTSVDPVIDVAACPLTVIDNVFSAQTDFTSDFIEDTGSGPAVVWLNNSLHDQDNSNLPTAQPLLDAGLNTFKTGYASDKYGSRVLGSFVNVLNVREALWYGSMTTGIQRPVIGLSVDTPQMGSGEITLPSLAAVTDLDYSIVGTPGVTQHLFRVLAKDAAGMRTLTSNEVNITTSHATLSGSNFIRLVWTQSPSATNYDIVERDLGTGTFRLVATVGAVGTYDVVANPAGALTYVEPTINETGVVVTQGSVATPVTATTTTYTVKPSDSVITCDATGGNYTVTLPAAAAANKGREYYFKRIDASGNLPTISGGGTNIDGAGTYVGLTAQWKYLIVKSSGSIWLIVASN